jgi:hypothetical protein
VVAGADVRRQPPACAERRVLKGRGWIDGFEPGACPSRSATCRPQSTRRRSISTGRIWRCPLTGSPTNPVQLSQAQGDRSYEKKACRAFQPSRLPVRTA